ncbi:MAG: hypothetical protein ACLQNE_18810 [Thermoguttaceae bacterium]
MSTSNSLLTRVFPVRREHTYDGILTTFAAVGNGKTVVVSQIEDQPLYIDVYGLDVSTVEELQGKKAIKSVELDQPIPSGDELQVLAARYLTG